MIAVSEKVNGFITQDPLKLSKRKLVSWFIELYIKAAEVYFDN